jgi:hypothetical protein
MMHPPPPQANSSSMPVASKGSTPTKFAKFENKRIHELIKNS